MDQILGDGHLSKVSLLSHAHRTSLPLFVPSLTSSAGILFFIVYRPCTYFVSFVLKYFMVWYYFLNF